MIFIHQSAVLTTLAFAFSSVRAAQPILNQYGPNEKTGESFLCREALDCRDCVVNGCGWGMGECMDSCREIADASCYSQELFPLLTPRQICRMDWVETRDWEICGTQLDCGSCTSTPLYNAADGNCFWYPETSSCSPLASDWTGQGMDVCFTDPKQLQCYNAGSNCDSCLEAGCEWAANTCVPSCDEVADASCYGEDVFPQLSIHDICRRAAMDQADHNTCSHQNDCFSCTATIQSDGYSKCQWYTDDFSGESWCGTGGCDMNGNCGTDTCAPIHTDLDEESVSLDNVSPCTNMTSCLSCMDNDNECAWMAGRCGDSCNVIADAACYQKANFPNWEEEAICQHAADVVVNEVLCNATSCDECTSTLMVGGTSTCTWYTSPADSNQGWCGTGGCDMMGNCGSKACAVKAPTASLRGVGQKQEHHSHNGISSFFKSILEP